MKGVVVCVRICQGPLKDWSSFHPQKHVSWRQLLMLPHLLDQLHLGVGIVQFLVPWQCVKSYRPFFEMSARVPLLALQGYEVRALANCYVCISRVMTPADTCWRVMTRPICEWNNTERASRHLLPSALVCARLLVVGRQHFPPSSSLCVRWKCASGWLQGYAR